MVLAAHATVALRRGVELRLPAHPAFTAARRLGMQLPGGDVADPGGWTAWLRSVGAAAVLLDDAGVGGDPQIRAQHTGTAEGLPGWRLADDSGVVLGHVLAAERSPALRPVASVGEATSTLRAAADTALSGAAQAPQLWRQSASRAVAILDSAGTGEELSDVAWPHFLLPTDVELAARRLSAAAATLWMWDGPGAWVGPSADAAHQSLGGQVEEALISAVAAC